MREIKFRGMCIVRGKIEWLYGCYTYNLKTGNHFIYEQETEKIYIVYGKTVGQYTGLKDKNGVEIYEGDYFVDDRIKWVIVWNDKNAGFGFETYDLKDNTFIEYVSIANMGELNTWFEVTGNIHEGG